MNDRGPRPHIAAQVPARAFAGLRTAEVVGLRTSDADFLHLYINPAQQLHKHTDGAEQLKSDTSATPIPISEEMARDLAAAIAGGAASTW